MELNYINALLISFVPLFIAYIWYHQNSPLLRWSGENGIHSLSSLGAIRILVAFLLSFSIVFGYMNLVIHQMGFYELFLTDILQGDLEAKRVADEFLAKYGQKHRHFGHGCFHGAINAVVFAVPFIGFFALLERRDYRFFFLHFSYWLFTSMVIGGLIAAFV